MGGSWRVFRLGERWRRSPRRAWLVIRTPEHEVVQLDGNVASIGNIWKSEACFMAGVDSSRALGYVRDEEALAAVRAGRPCRRCGEPIAARRQSEAGRTTFWCPRCQS